MKLLSFTTLKMAAIAATLLATATVQAHTIALGTTNAGGLGNLMLWMGTYDHGSPIAQGSITLTALDGNAITNITSNFTQVVTTQPTGLVAGDNYFYADAAGGSQWGTLASDSYHSALNNVGLGPAVNWQGALFTGLTAGI